MKMLILLLLPACMISRVEGDPSGPDAVGELYLCGPVPLEDPRAEGEEFCWSIHDPEGASWEWTKMTGADSVCLGAGDPEAGGAGVLVLCLRGE